MKAHKVQGTTTLGELDELVLATLRDRDWDNLPPRALAISISLEANELLEHYQWQEESVGNHEAVADELADIIICALQFAEVTDIDIAKAVRTKLAKVAEKYPAENFKGKQGEDLRKAWIEAKMKHRKNSL